MKHALLLLILVQTMSNAQTIWVPGTVGSFGGPHVQIQHNGASSYGVGLLLLQTAVGNSDGPKMQFTKTMTSSKNWTFGILNGVDVPDFSINEDGSLSGGFGVPRMVFKAGGNVGIGTNNPLTKLQVDINNLNNVYDAATVGIYSRNTNATDNNYNGLQFGDASGWGVAGIMAQVKSHANHTASMSFFTRKNGAAPAPQMTLDENGQLGIGTTTPDSKLTVKGTIHSQEVKVDLNGSVAPDYVFEKDYQLTSLEELKSYIDQNKHLPEIPSAKEMEQEGVNLKEMNLKLLQKIEELTLHIINQEQRIQQLEKDKKE